jgi:hypothetical protein
MSRHDLLALADACAADTARSQARLARDMAAVAATFTARMRWHRAAARADRAARRALVCRDLRLSILGAGV